MLSVMTMDGQCVSKRMLVSMFFVSVEPLDRLCAEPALGPICDDLNIGTC